MNTKKCEESFWKCLSEGKDFKIATEKSARDAGHRKRHKGVSPAVVTNDNSSWLVAAMKLRSKREKRSSPVSVNLMNNLVTWKWNNKRVAQDNWAITLRLACFMNCCERDPHALESGTQSVKVDDDEFFSSHHFENKNWPTWGKTR